MASAEPKRLINSLKLLLAHYNIKTFAELAKQLKTTPSTLSRNIHALAKTKDYEAAFPSALVSHLSITTDKLKEQLTQTELSDPTIMDRFIGDKYHQLADAQGSYLQEIMELFKQLNRGDRYTFVTSDLPFEYEEAEFRKTIVSAIQRNVFFRYIFPDPEKVRFSKQFELYYRHGAIDDRWKRLKESHQRFISYLHGSYSISLDILNEHLKCYHSDDCFLMNPLMKFMLVEKDYIDHIECRAFVESQIGRHDMVDSLRQWSPLGRVHTRIIADAVERAINKSTRKFKETNQ